MRAWGAQSREDAVGCILGRLWTALAEAGCCSVVAVCCSVVSGFVPQHAGFLVGCRVRIHWLLLERRTGLFPPTPAPAHGPVPT